MSESAIINDSAAAYKIGKFLSIKFQPRPLLLLENVTPQQFFNNRMKDTFGTNFNALIIKLGFPVFMEWNKLMEQHLTDTEKHGHVETSLTDDYRAALVRCGPRLAMTYSVSVIESAMTAILLRKQTEVTSVTADTGSGEPQQQQQYSEWFHSIVRQSDYAPRIKTYYIANVLEKFFLPRRWAVMFLGPEASKEEVAIYTSPVSFGCAFEDYLKRYALVTLADCTVFSIATLLNFIPRVRTLLSYRELEVPKGRTRVRNAARYIWKEPEAPTPASAWKDIKTKFALSFRELALGAIGAAIGSWLAGGYGGALEFWFSFAPSMIYSVYEAKDMIQDEVQKKMKEVEEQMVREEMKRLAEQEQQGNKKRANNNTSAGKRTGTRNVTLANDQDVENNRASSEVNDNNNNNNAPNFKSNTDKYDDDNDDGNYEDGENPVLTPTSMKSPINQHYPLQKPQQVEIVLEDDEE